MVVRHERDLVAAHVAEVDPEAVIADQDGNEGIVCVDASAATMD